MVSKKMQCRAYEGDVDVEVARLGRSTENASVESLNGRFLAECLNSTWNLSLADA